MIDRPEYPTNGGNRWIMQPRSQRVYDLLNAGDVDGFGDVLADDFVEHEELPGFDADERRGQGLLPHVHGRRFPTCG